MQNIYDIGTFFTLLIATQSYKTYQKFQLWNSEDHPHYVRTITQKKIHWQSSYNDTSLFG